MKRGKDDHTTQIKAAGIIGTVANEVTKVAEVTPCALPLPWPSLWPWQQLREVRVKVALFLEESSVKPLWPWPWQLPSPWHPVL